MAFRWMYLGAASLVLVGVHTAAGQPPREREGGLLPPLAGSVPPVVQVVAKEPADEVEVLVEVIKVMPKTREEARPKPEKNDNFRVIKIKREDDEAPAPTLPVPPAKHAAAPRPMPQPAPRPQEPLKFVPRQQQEQLPTARPTPRPTEYLATMFPGERPVKIVKVQAPDKAAHNEDTRLPVEAPTVPTSFTGYPGALGTVGCDAGPMAPPFSAVGWIDSAIIATQARVRYDARYENERHDRAEFYMARNQQFFTGVATGISGRGFPIPERNIDLKDYALYLEYAFGARWSAFVEGTIREMDPFDNANNAGIGDMNVGFKVAYFMLPEQVQTFQLRVFIPTGRPETGLGNGHATIEPALLLWQKLSDNWTLESEIRDWIPVGGTNYAGNVLRYGLGLSYSAYRTDNWSLTPVGEIIGWSVLTGKESRFVDLLPTFQETHDAAGTIFEAAFGVRGTATNRCDWYLGYSRALTTAKAWFNDNLRLEVRWHF